MTFAVYAALAGSHKGEFWPFSIYPMFSKAGQPWTRTFVRDITKEKRTISGDIQREEELYGKPFSLNEVNVHQNDLSNFMSKNKEWDENKKAVVRNYFKSTLKNKSLLIYKVRGELVNSDAFISYKPFVLLTPDTTMVFND